MHLDWTIVDFTHKLVYYQSLKVQLKTLELHTMDIDSPL